TNEVVNFCLTTGCPTKNIALLVEFSQATTNTAHKSDFGGNSQALSRGYTQGRRWVQSASERRPRNNAQAASKWAAGCLLAVTLKRLLDGSAQLGAQVLDLIQHATEQPALM